MAALGNPGGQVSNTIPDESARFDKRQIVAASAAPVAQGGGFHRQHLGGLGFVDLGGDIFGRVAESAAYLSDDLGNGFGLGLHGKAPIGCG